MKTPKKKEDTIKLLEKEIIALQDEQTELLRRRWKLDAQIAEQRKRIEELEVGHIQEQEKKGLWQKTTAVLLAMWLLFLSLFSNEKE
jgi:septal ring factor EnvC (AmiA/AmiB activator)